MTFDSHQPTSQGAPATVAERMALGATRARLLGMAHHKPTLGRYELGELIGKGGMAEVHRAFDPSLRRTVALKVVTGSKRRTAARIVREAQAQASLAHPNVVEVYDVGAVGADVFIAMELMEGPSLQQWLRASTRAWREVLDVFVEAAHGLVAAHAADLVHRDFKPGNVLMTRDGRIKVADFGLAIRSQDTSELAASSEEGETQSLESRLTETGATVGTPLYMAPEQHQGHRLDAKADQYAFCVALLEGLLGETPFSSSSMLLLAEEKRRRPKLTKNPKKVPRRILAAALRGLEPHASDRWPSMEVLVDTLMRASKGRRTWSAAAVGSLAIGASAWMWLGDRPADGCGDLRLQWNDDMRQRIESAFAETRAPHAATTWVRMRGDLDAYAQSWAAAVSEVCETEPRPRFEDARVSCLRRQQRRFDALVTALASVRSEAVDDAAMAESSLDRPRRCLDPDFADDGVPPSDPDAQAIEQLLAEANALTTTYHFERARELAMAALVRAEEAGHRSLIADAQLQVGLIDGMADRNDAAIEHLERAYFVADEIGAHWIAATAASKLVFSLSVVEGTVEQMDRWNAYAHAHLDALAGGGPKASVMLSIGTMWLRRGDYPKAVDASLQAAAAFEAEYGPTHSGVAAALSNAGYAYTELGNVDDALEVLARASKIYDEVLGPRHPGRGQVAINRGMALYRSARYSDALESFEQAIEIFGGQPQVPGGMLARSEMNRGLCLLELGRADESLEGMQRARQLYIDAYGSTHPELASVDMNIGLIHHRQSRFDDALAAYERAWATQVEQLGAEHPRAALTEHNMGVTLNEAQRYDEAATRLRSALRVFESKVGPRSDLVAAASMELGHALDRSGESSRGLTLIGNAIEILDARASDNDRFIVMAMVYRAQALGSLDRPFDAQRELDRALERAGQLSDPDPQLSFDLHHERGRVAASLGRHDAARHSIRTALDIAGSEPVPPAKLEAARQLLAKLRS